MKHLEASFKGRNNLWRYIIMIVMIFIITNTIGSLPLIIISLIKSPDINSLTTMGIDQNMLLALMLFPFIIGLAAYALIIQPMHGRSFMETVTGANKIRWSRMLISGLVWMFLMAVYLFVYIGFDPENFSINNTGSSLILLGLIALILIPFQAAFEEVLFRGYLMQGFTLLIPGRLFPLVASSLMFALMHSMNPEVKEYGFFTVMPQYLTFGLVFGIITILDDGIETAIGAHAANNVFLSVMVTQKSSALQTDALYLQHGFHPWIELAGLAVSGFVLIMILKKTFKWKGFSFLISKVQNANVQSQMP